MDFPTPLALTSVYILPRLSLSRQRDIPSGPGLSARCGPARNSSISSIDFELIACGLQAFPDPSITSGSDARGRRRIPQGIRQLSPACPILHFDPNGAMCFQPIGETHVRQDFGSVRRKVDAHFPHHPRRRIHIDIRLGGIIHLCRKLAFRIFKISHGSVAIGGGSSGYEVKLSRAVSFPFFTIHRF